MASFGGWILVIVVAFFGGFSPVWLGLSSRIAPLVFIASVIIPSLIYFLFYLTNLGVTARGMWPLGLAFQFMQSAFVAALGWGIADWLKHFNK